MTSHTQPRDVVLTPPRARHRAQPSMITAGITAVTRPRPARDVDWPAPSGERQFVREILLVSAVTIGLGFACWASAQIHLNDALHLMALFGHLACLVVGFGAVLTVDRVGMQWFLGQKPFEALVSSLQGTHAQIWLGYAGLVATGMFLEPDLSSAGTLVKLALVFTIGINGVFATRLGDRLSAGPGAEVVTPRTMVTMLVVGGISQAGWWGATLIGFINAH